MSVTSLATPTTLDNITILPMPTQEESAATTSRPSARTWKLTYNADQPTRLEGGKFKWAAGSWQIITSDGDPENNSDRLGRFGTSSKQNQIDPSSWSQCTTNPEMIAEYNESVDKSVNSETCPDYLIPHRPLKVTVGGQVLDSTIRCYMLEEEFAAANNVTRKSTGSFSKFCIRVLCMIYADTLLQLHHSLRGQVQWCHLCTRA